MAASLSQTRCSFVLGSLLCKSRYSQGWQQKGSPVATQHGILARGCPPPPDSPAAPLTRRDALSPIDLGEERRSGRRVVRTRAGVGGSRGGRRAGGRRSCCSGGHGWRFGPFCCHRTLQEAAGGKASHQLNLLQDCSTPAALSQEAPAGLLSSYRFAPGQPRGVVLLDVGLQLAPDTQVGLYPVHLLLISEDTRRSCGGSRCICHHSSRTIDRSLHICLSWTSTAVSHLQH